MNNRLIDISKRNTLKTLGGSALLVATPAVASAACFSGGDHYAREMTSENTLVVSEADLHIELTVDPEPILTMTNTSDELIIVRHVHPGVVHVGHKAFDINSVFERSAYAVSAGSSRRVKVSPVAHTTAEASFPRSRYRDEPQRIVSVVATTDEFGTVVNSTRSFFA